MILCVRRAGMKFDQDRLNTLLAHLVDEVITEEEISEMEVSSLMAIPEAQSHYFRYLGVHEDLSEHATVPCTLSDRVQGTLRLKSMVTLAAAAALAGGIVLYLFLFHPGETGSGNSRTLAARSDGSNRMARYIENCSRLLRSEKDGSRRWVLIPGRKSGFPTTPVCRFPVSPNCILNL